MWVVFMWVVLRLVVLIVSWDNVSFGGGFAIG